MLRLAVIALLLANAGYYAYTQGWLRSAGLVTPEQAEPQRLQQQIRPETALISVGKGNSYGHPHPSTLTTLQSLEVKVRRTDEEGALHEQISVP